MKKSLIALAVLAAAGAASAQSSITLYGRIDANVTQQKSGDLSALSGDSVTRMNDGGVNGVGGSRWGLRGTEDLGGGLKAYFTLESGFNADDGSQGAAGVQFNRQAYVAVGSASLGDIRLGRVETLTRELNVGFTDVTGESELSIVDGTGAFAPASNPLFQNLNTRVNNAVEYRSPVFSGFQVIGLVAAGEGTTARHQGASATFRSGPIAAGLVYEEYDGFGETYNKVLTVGGNYNFGFATLFLGYQNTTDFGVIGTAPTLGVDVDGYNIGVMVPFGNWQVRAQYTQSTRELVNGTELDNKKSGISVRYALSKRTSAYAGYTNRSGDTSDTLLRKEEFFAGVGHNF